MAVFHMSFETEPMMNAEMSMYIGNIIAARSNIRKRKAGRPSGLVLSGQLYTVVNFDVTRGRCKFLFKIFEGNQ